MESMKTTVDIPAEELTEAMRHLGVKTKRAAVVAAIRAFNRRKRIESLLARFGQSDDFMTQRELQRLRRDEHRA